MFSIARGAREGSRSVRQSHLDSLLRFPPGLVDRGSSGEVAPPPEDQALPGLLCALVEVGTLSDKVTRSRGPRLHNLLPLDLTWRGLSKPQRLLFLMKQRLRKSSFVLARAEG